jgi:hypothetical protein
LADGADFFLESHFDRGSAGTYHARAMGNPLQDRRTPLELAASRQVIEFKDNLSDFARLEGIIENDLGALDPDKLPLGWRETEISGRLSFGFAKLPLSVELKLLFAGGESTAADDDEFEVWELEEETLRPLDLVEEALIMAMPLAAMHDEIDGCHGSGFEDAGSGDKIRPFAALKAQMDNEN